MTEASDVGGGGERAALAAAVHDAFATVKRSLALVRLHHADHDTVRDLARQAGKKLEAAVAQGDIDIGVEAKSLSFRGKPVMLDEGTESACGTLFASGLERIVLGPGLTDEGIVTFVRVWGRAADRRQPLSSDHTFATLMWEAGVPGVEIVPRVDDALGDAAQQEIMARRVALSSSLAGAKPLPLPSGAPPAMPALDIDAPLKVFLTRSLLAMSRVAGHDRTTLLGVSAKAIVRALGAGAVKEVADAYAAAVERGQALAAQREGVAADLEAVCGCLATDEVRQALVAGAGAVTDSAGAEAIVGVVRYLPRRQVAVLGAVLGGASKQAKEALSQRLQRLKPADHEWGALVQAAGAQGAADIFEVARALSPTAAASVVDAARNVSDESFVAVAGKLRGTELEVARPALTAALNKPGTAQLAEDMLIRAKDPGVVKRVLARLTDEARPIEQRKAAATALSRLDDEASRAGLRQVFGAAKNDELKAAVALALGTLRDQASRPALEAIAKKLIVDRALKRACEEALKRLDRAPGQSGGGT